jgi:hypothetical protein
LIWIKERALSRATFGLTSINTGFGFLVQCPLRAAAAKIVMNSAQRMTEHITEESERLRTKAEAHNGCWLEPLLIGPGAVSMASLAANRERTWPNLALLAIIALGLQSRHGWC